MVGHWQLEGKRIWILKELNNFSLNDKNLQIYDSHQHLDWMNVSPSRLHIRTDWEKKCWMTSKVVVASVCFMISEMTYCIILMMMNVMNGYIDHKKMLIRSDLTMWISSIQMCLSVKDVCKITKSFKQIETFKLFAILVVLIKW